MDYYEHLLRRSTVVPADARQAIKGARRSLEQSRARLAHSDATLQQSQARLRPLSPEWRSRRAQLALLHALVLRLSSA